MYPNNNYYPNQQANNMGQSIFDELNNVFNNYQPKQDQFKGINSIIDELKAMQTSPPTPKQVQNYFGQLEFTNEQSQGIKLLVEGL